MGNIVSLPPTTTMTPEQALASALDFAQSDGLQDVVIVGYDSDGVLFVRSSRMDRKDALWMAKQFELYALKGE